MIYTVTLHPALDRTLTVPGFAVGEVNRVLLEHTEPGGKGINVAKVLSVLGEPSCAMALLGGARGAEFIRCAAVWPMETDFVETSAETRVNTKVFDPVSGETTDINADCPWDAAAAEVLRGRLLGRLQAGDVVVLSGSLPGGAPQTLYAEWIAACRAQGARVILDASGPCLAHALSAGPDASKPNVEELSQLAGTPLYSDGERLAAARERLADAALMLLSAGAQGAYWITRQAAFFAPALPVQARCSVGAGDSMVAALALGMQRGLEAEEIFRLAVAAGAACVEAGGSGAMRGERVRVLSGQVQPVQMDQTAAKSAR